jgi:hypothetical protein
MTDQPKELSFDQVEEFGPILKWKHIFRLASETFAEDISQAVQTLFSFLDELISGAVHSHSDLRKRFRVQLRRAIDDQWHLEMLLDPVLWYNSHRNAQGEVSSENEEKANRYVSWVFQNFLRSHTYPADCADSSWIQCYYKTEEACDSHRIRQVTPECPHGHIEWECGAKISASRCNFRIFKERRRECYCRDDAEAAEPKCHFCQFEAKGLVTLVRKESLAEFVLAPTPDSVQRNTFPHTNEDLIRSSRVWSLIHDYCSSLSTYTLSKSSSSFPVTRIVFNFGEWETAMHRNRDLNECHAHVHFWLDKLVLPLFETLYDHFTTPEDYMWINAIDLQSVLKSRK